MSVTLLTNTKPLYTHDCDLCTFLGSFEHLGEVLDAYKSCDASSYPYSARYSDDGADYVTVFDVASPLYAPCKELEDMVSDPLYKLRTEREQLVEKREGVLRELQSIMGQIQGVDDDILLVELQGSDWEDRELLAMESEAENGVAY